MPSEYNIQDLPPANSFCSTHNNGKSLKKWRFTDSKAFPVDWRATCDLFRETELNVRISKRQQPMKCSEQKCIKQSHIDGLPHSPFFFSGKINSFIYYCAAVWNILEFQSSIFPNSPFRGWDSISLPKSNPLSFIYINNLTLLKPNIPSSSSYILRPIGLEGQRSWTWVVAPCFHESNLSKCHTSNLVGLAAFFVCFWCVGNFCGVHVRCGNLGWNSMVKQFSWGHLD